MTSYRPSVAAVAPLLAGPASGYETKLDLKSKKVVAVLSGGNIDAELLFRIMKARIGRGSDVDS